MDDVFLPGVPGNAVRAAYAKAPGNEIDSGKFANPESSAALVANAFGFFLERPADLPVLPGGDGWGWPVSKLWLEELVRFPWSGGSHPCLDVLIETGSTLVGIESKRYEPYRSRKRTILSQAYWRRVWGDAMGGYERVRDGLKDGTKQFAALDAPQLIKHAFGLRTAVHRHPAFAGERPVLVYLYAEPSHWPDGRAVPPVALAQHRAEIQQFALMVAGAEVALHACSYRRLLDGWAACPDPVIADHAAAVAARYHP